MAKSLTQASPEYVDLVKEVVATKSNLNYIEFQVYNIKKSKKDVIKVQKANELVELALDKEDLVVVSLYERAFDLVDDQTKRLWIENAINAVRYDMEKEKVVIDAGPTINVGLGMYHAYGDVIIQKLELAALTLQQIEDQDKEKKAQEKAAKKGKKK
jgi:hypothetical protein